MPTVSKSIADRVVSGNGWYPGDSTPVTKIVEYDNAFGGVSYGLIYENQNPDTYEETEYVRNPRTYWETGK